MCEILFRLGHELEKSNAYTPQADQLLYFLGSYEQICSILCREITLTCRVVPCQRKLCCPVAHVSRSRR